MNHLIKNNNELKGKRLDNFPIYAATAHEIAVKKFEPIDQILLQKYYSDINIYLFAIDFIIILTEPYLFAKIY